MTTPETQFEAFRHKYEAWRDSTQNLPLKRDRVAKGSSELELDHLIDYVQPIAAAAAERSTQFDYPKVAREYLQDLEKIQKQLGSASLGGSGRQVYLSYLTEFRHLLTDLGALPVPTEGHLGFRGHALQAFRFLIDEHGFEVGETSPISVRFTSDAMFVALSYSPECPMDSVLVGRRTGEETPVSGFILDDFAYVDGLGVLFDYERFDLRDKGGVAKFLETAASLIRRRGGSVLNGEEEALRGLQRNADEREQAYIKMMEREHSDQR